MEMDYIALCRNFYSATNIPVTLTKNNHAVYSSLDDILAQRLYITGSCSLWMSSIIPVSAEIFQILNTAAL